MKSDLFLQKIENLIASEDKPLSFQEACTYLNISPSYLYKLTHNNRVPHFKPNGKKIYFLKTDLRKWLLRNRVSTIEEIDQKAGDYVMINEDAI